MKLKIFKNLFIYFLLFIPMSLGVISFLNFELDLLFPEQETTPRDIAANNKK